MALTTANMGLRSWNSASDNFSYTELANNWTAVDAHDHSTGKGVLIPTAGIANLAVTNAKLAANAVDSGKIVDGSITDADLASPHNGVYRTLFFASGLFNLDSATGVFLFTDAGAAWTTGTAISSGSVSIFYLQASQLSVAGKTTRLRTSILVAENAVSSGAVYQVGLYPVTSGGTADAIAITAGAVVASSTASVTGPTGSSVTHAASVDFSMPADGAYALGVNVTGTNGINAAANITARLSFRHT